MKQYRLEIRGSHLTSPLVKLWYELWDNRTPAYTDEWNTVRKEVKEKYKATIVFTKGNYWLEFDNLEDQTEFKLTYLYENL